MILLVGSEKAGLTNMSLMRATYLRKACAVVKEHMVFLVFNYLQSGI